MHFSGRPSVIGADRFSQGSELAQVVEGESESTKNMVKKNTDILGKCLEKPWKVHGNILDIYSDVSGFCYINFLPIGQSHF